MRVLISLIALEFIEMTDRIWQSLGSVLAGTIMSAMLLGFTTLPMLLPKPMEIDPTRLEIVNPMKPTEFAKADFTPALRAVLIPQIKLVACIFSEKAVKHHVRPDQAGLPICPSRDIQVTIDDNMINITVSGMANIDKIDRPFTVVLQHNPPSVTEDGLIVTGIKVDPVK